VVAPASRFVEGYRDGLRVRLLYGDEPEPPRRRTRPEGCCCDHVGWVDAGCKLHGLSLPWPAQAADGSTKPIGWLGRRELGAWTTDPFDPLRARRKKGGML